MRKDDKKRTYIIIGLCAILVVMAVGYAAFSQMLTINGTATNTNSWCLGFDQTKTNTYTVTKGVQSGTTPTGSMTYSGTTCQTNYVPTSTLSSVFYQPGDQIEYTLTIKNASSVTAAIKSILVDNQSITSETTITKGNIQYTVKLPSASTLAANAETTMKVIAKFQNTTPISGEYSGETQTVEVKINAEQDDGTGGMDVPYTGAIYRYSTTHLTNKGSGSASTVPYTITNLTKGTDYITEADYPTYNDRATFFGKTYYLKHDVEGDEIIYSYVCYISDTEHCMKANFASESGIRDLIHAYQTYYSLSEVSNPSFSNNGCQYWSTYFAKCYTDTYHIEWGVSYGGASVHAMIGYGTSNNECVIAGESNKEAYCRDY